MKTTMMLTLSQQELCEVVEDWLHRHKGELARDQRVSEIKAGRQTAYVKVSLEQTEKKPAPNSIAA